MPASDKANRPPLWRRILVATAILAAIIILDVALTLALEPYGSNSDSVWYEYRQAIKEGEQFETLVIGSSVAQDSLQPDALNEILGTTSFCLASPGQSLKSSCKALEVALDENPVKRVILGTSYTQLADVPWPNSNMAFTQALVINRPASEQIARYAGLLLDKDYVGTVSSLAFLAPFTLSHVDYTPSAIMQNVRNRLECASPLEAQARIDGAWRPLGHGYANYEGQVNPETFEVNDTGVDRYVFSDQRDQGLNESELEGLEDICILCEKRGVELVVFAPPHPRFEVLSIADAYPREMAQVMELITSHGGIFLDFNLARSELYENRESDFIDAVHLNQAGASRFSPILANTMRQIESGEDVGTLFFGYDQWEEFLSSLEAIYFVYFEEKQTEEGLALEAKACAGSNIQVEYLFERQEADGSWTVLRDWSSDPTLVLSESGYRNVNVRVVARRTGTTEPERYHYQTITLL